MINGFLIFLRVGLAFSVIFKAYLHTNLARRNNVSMQGGGGEFSFKVLWYFTQPVSEEYERQKKTCNAIQTINLIVLLIIITMELLPK